MAVLVLGERPGGQALAGTALVVVSVFVLSGGRGLLAPERRLAVAYGLVTGLFIGVYTVWDGYAVGVLGVAVLSPLAYLMVLTAMSFTPISLVAPTREVSILIGTLLGTRLLAEGDGKLRLLGAVGMVIGVALLATG